MAPTSATPSDATPAGTAFLLSLAAEIRRVDVALVITVIIVALLFVWLAATVIRKALEPRSYMYLEVKTGENVAIFPLWTFPNASRYFSVTVPAPGLQLRLRYFGLFGGIVNIGQ
jgi:hypothetical protein